MTVHDGPQELAYDAALGLAEASRGLALLLGLPREHGFHHGHGGRALPEEPGQVALVLELVDQEGLFQAHGRALCALISLTCSTLSLG